MILVTNLLTEGRGMWQFTAAEAVRVLGAAIGRPIDVVVINTAQAGAGDPRRATAPSTKRRSSSATFPRSASR